MSHGQGGDYMKYHQGQHGGMASVDSIGRSVLPESMQGAAMQAGVMAAYDDIRGLRDMAGGKRRKRRSQRRSKRSKRSQRCQRKQGGGALGYAPYGTPSMLLSSSGYSQAGLSPDWRGSGVEFNAARQREAM